MLPLRFAIRCLTALGCALVCGSASAELLIQPGSISLRRHFDRVQLLVTDKGSSPDRREDLTGKVVYESSNTKVATVSASGRVLARGNGKARILVQHKKQRAEVPVVVTGLKKRPKVLFNSEIVPILSKLGCNMGACHASQFGKGGFKLSVFGFAPGRDYRQITRDWEQRRIAPVDPTRSLLLLKPTMKVAHGGGYRLKPNSIEHDILAAWIAAGAPRQRGKIPQVERLAVAPRRRVSKPGSTQQLQVVAHYNDGTSRDVTAWAKYDSMDDGILQVDGQGRVSVQGQGQAPIMVRYEGQAEIAMFVVPYSSKVKLTGWRNNNYVDKLAADKFRELGIEPSGLCSDETFIRRAFLDSTGTLPTIKEVQRFLSSKDKGKRGQLIDQLLGLTGDPKLDVYNDRYAAFWSLKWSDLIRNNSRDLGEQGMWALHNWIRESFRTNKPFDKFVTELVTARGSIYMNGPANYFRINNNSSKLTESTAQLFLGVRLECAKCHHHPFEKFSQDDYYGFSAFFARVGTKSSQEFGLFGRESVVVVKTSGSVRNPRSGKTMKPTPLGGKPLSHPIDQRIPLAKWLTAKDNRFFAKAVVNRYVSYLLGRGLVEPVDDIRSTNPPSNVALMDALAKDLIQHKFNLKHLLRTIMVSRLYQLSSTPTKANATDRRFFSHYRVKRLAAEPLLDAIDYVTDVKTKFKSLPQGTRAIELPDAEYPNFFLNTFAKPRRTSVCECERSPDENLVQALHTLNGKTLAAKISAKNGRIAKLIKSKKTPDQIFDQIYLATLCRQPRANERKACHQFLKQSPTPREFYEDLVWALINSKDFLFVH